MPAFGHLPEAEILAIAEWLRQPKGAAQAPTDAGGTTRTGAANTVQGDNDDGGRRRRGRGRGRSGGNGD